MGDFEEQFVYPYRLQPLQYFRFLDDCFLIWQHSLEELDLFVNHMNTRMESIKFTKLNQSNNTIETDF